MIKDGSPGKMWKQETMMPSSQMFCYTHDADFDAKLSPTVTTLQETDNPDLRDRAYIYWRLLSTDPEAAKEVVLAEKPVISNSAYTIEPPLVDVLLKNIASIASVYHKPPEVSLSTSSAALLSFLGEYTLLTSHSQGGNNSWHLLTVALSF